MPIVLYQSKEKSKTSRETKYKETLKGNETEINTLIASLIIGTTQKEGLYLQSWRKTQFGGDIWQLQCEYAELDNWISYSSLPDSLVGVKSATLSVRNLQLPLENLDDYLQKWNHYLIQLCSPSESPSVPSWYNSLKYGQFPPTSARENYRIISSPSEIPLQPQGEGENKKYWIIASEPSKPGVQYYDFAVFTVTELSRYRTASAAGTALDKAINTITAPSNNFGITGGNWKLDQANVQYDGNAWIATNVYTHSPDGWDSQLYSNGN